MNLATLSTDDIPGLTADELMGVIQDARYNRTLIDNAPHVSDTAWGMSKRLFKLQCAAEKEMDRRRVGAKTGHQKELGDVIMGSAAE